MDDSGPVRRWVPISRDHDEAFVKLDGLLLHLAREVEIHATNANEVLEVARVDDRYVDVSIRADEPGSVPCRGFSLDARSYEEWIGSDLDRYPPREWGGWTRPLPWADAGPEMGLLLGMSVVRTRYGFRRIPYASQIVIQAGLTTGEGWGRVHGHARFYGENSDTHFDLDAGISDIAFLRYHGLGNDTREDTRARDFSVELNELHLAPSIGVPLGPRLEVTLVADVTSDRPSGDDSPFFRSVSDTLYGAGDFTRVGLSAGLAWHSERESPVHPTSLAAEVKSRVVPAVWDVRSTYADLAAEVGAHVGAPARVMKPSLSLKAGGRSIFGSAPVQDAAYLGGRRNLRGWSRERFAGDAAVYGSAELRLQLVSTQVVLPANVGVLGLYDVGRVFVNGDSPGGWHKGVGLGLWVSFLDPDNTLSVTWAKSRERTAFYVGMGFAF